VKRPSELFPKGGARPVIGEKPPELRKRLRKWQVVAVENVHGALSVSHTIYPQVGVCVNRIGMHQQGNRVKKGVTIGANAESIASH
jgi:hypothetical protein